jgi:similar to stage IV sporulation protein
MLAEFLKFCGGTVRLRVRTAYPERFLNLCAQYGIWLYGADRADVDVLFVTIRLRDFRTVQSFVRKVHGRMAVVRRKGLPFWLHRAGHRYGLWGGAVFFLVTLYLLFTRIWAIDIAAPPGVSQREILEELNRLGLRCGVVSDRLDVKAIQQEIMLERQDLAFLAVNLHGNQARVQVRVRRPKPEILDEDQITKVVALKTGVITKMEVKGGTAVKKVGETVMKGELLIDAAIQPTQEEAQPFLSHAFGQVEARTWERIHSVRCLAGEKKGENRKIHKRYALVVGKKRINLYFDSGIDLGSCDKISKEKKIILGDGYLLPVYLVQQQWISYDTQETTLSPDALQADMERQGQKEIQNRIQGEILHISHSFSVQGELAVLDTVSECREQIGEVVADGRKTEDLLPQDEKKGSE